MKRYLVTLTGRANCIYGKLRGNELVCSYVHANSKKKAVELFWGEIEKNENFNAYSRRDFKIEAELWNEDELDHYGNPLKDWESAIEFSNLYLIRFNHCTGKYELADKPQESSEPVAQENIQPEHEDATESISEPQETSPRLFKKSKRLEIPKTEIDKWNRMLASAKGSSTYYTFTLWNEGNDEHGRWFALGHGDIRAHMISHPSDCYFIKKIKKNTWLYFEDCAGIQERWLLSDVARAFFLPEPSDDERNDSRGSQKASESSSDSSNEIIKKNSAKPTEEKSEGKEGITTSLIAVGEFLVIEERKNGESWAYYHGNDFLWSSAERFSQVDLLRMYENGYFMEELTKQRIRKYDAIEKCKDNDFPDDVLVRMRNELNAIDDEIARLFSKEVKDEHI